MRAHRSDDIPYLPIPKLLWQTAWGEYVYDTELPDQVNIRWFELGRWGKPAIVGPLSNSHGNTTVVANGPGTFIQLSANHSHAPNRLLSTGYTYDVSNPGESGEQIPYYRFAPATTTVPPKNKMLYTLRVQRRGFQVAESVHHRLGRYWPAKRRPIP